MNPDKAHKSDLSRVIILDIILIVAFASCILITTLMYDNESEKAAQKYINSNASSLEHNLEILDFENWDLIIRDFIDYYNMDVIVTDPNGDITYIFARGAMDSENSIYKTLEIGSTGYTLIVSAIPSDVTIIDNNTVSVSLNILLVNAFIVIILIVTSFIQSYRNQIVRMATTDELTGLSNRKSFIERYNEMNQKGKLEDAVIFMIDVDKFKGINDNNGHASGDTALKYIGLKLKELEGSNIIAGRWGGDEFIGIIKSQSGDSVQKAKRILTDLMKDVNKAQIIEGITLSLSIGMASIIDSSDITKNMERADAALYASKNNGRGILTDYNDLADNETDVLRSDTSGSADVLSNTSSKVSDSPKKSFDISKSTASGKKHPEMLITSWISTTRTYLSPIQMQVSMSRSLAES